MEIARFLSYAFHPLVVTAFGFLAFCLVKGCPLHSFVSTEAFFALIPYLITLYFRATGRARSVMLEGREALTHYALPAELPRWGSTHDFSGLPIHYPWSSATSSRLSLSS